MSDGPSSGRGGIWNLGALSATADEDRPTTPAADLGVDPPEAAAEPVEALPSPGTHQIATVSSDNVRRVHPSARPTRPGPSSPSARPRGAWDGSLAVPSTGAGASDTPSVPIATNSPANRGGSPDGAGSRGKLPLSVLIGVTVAVVAVAGVSVTALGGGGNDTEIVTPAGPSGAGSIAVAPGTVQAPAPVEALRTLEPTPEALPMDAEQAALVKLESLRAADVQLVTLNGQWVAQLASKVPGIYDELQMTDSGSHTFMAVDILAEHGRLRSADNVGAQVFLLKSTDYGERKLYNGEPMWVTFATRPFSSSQDVQAWCTRRFPDLSGAALQNACAPRQLDAIHG